MKTINYICNLRDLFQSLLNKDKFLSSYLRGARKESSNCIILYIVWNLGQKIFSNYHHVVKLWWILFQNIICQISKNRRNRFTIFFLIFQVPKTVRSLVNKILKYSQIIFDIEFPIRIAEKPVEGCQVMHRHFEPWVGIDVQNSTDFFCIRSWNSFGEQGQIKYIHCVLFLI